MEDTPDCSSIGDTADRHEADGGFDTVIFFRAIVKADDRLRTVGYTGNGHGDNFTDGIDYRHDAYIQIAAVKGERGVADNLDDAVGNGHHEVGKSESRDIPDGFQARAHAGYTDAQDSFWTGKKAYRPNGRSQLGYDSGDSRSPDTHTHGKNEKRIQNDIQHSADKSRDHTHPGKALGVNVTVHAQADGYKGTSQQINGKVAVGKGKGCITGAEGIQKGLFKQQPRDSEQDTGAQQHGKSIADHFFRPLDIAFSPGDGTERRTADPEQIGKGNDCGNNRHGKAQAC